MLVAFIKTSDAFNRADTNCCKQITPVTVKSHGSIAKDRQFFKLQREELANRQKKGGKYVSELLIWHEKQIRTYHLYPHTSQPTDSTVHEDAPTKWIFEINELNL